MAQLDEYLENQVLTATPAQLHLLAVDATLRHARRGRLALEEGQHDLANVSLEKARRGMTELLSGLKDEAAPELVKRQRGLFLYVYRSMAISQLLHRIDELDDAIRILDLHRQTWTDLLRQLTHAGTGGPHIRSWVT